jgi:tetratricopeptide (TPR) repeat protein
MRTWRSFFLIALAGVWPQLGCQQLPADNSVKDIRPIQQKAAEAPKQETTAVNPAQPSMAQAKALEDAQKISDALVMYETIRRSDNTQMLAATKKIAFIYLRYNELDRAEQEYQFLLKQNPRDADTLCALGDISYRRGHWGIAEKCFRDALARQPDHTNSLINLGMTLAQQGDNHYAASIETFKQVAGFSEAEAYCQVASIMKSNGKREEALRAYQTALAKEPGNQRARTELTLMYQADPSLATVRLTTPAKAEKRGVVEQEPAAPVVASEGTGRLMMQRPTLPPAPEFDLEECNARSWQPSVPKK